jgi:hypothetical protein
MIMARPNQDPLMRLPRPELEHVCDIAVEIGAPIEVGQTDMGLRRLIPITGGVVEGDAMRGKVLAGGADFQLILAGQTQAHLDARYVLELEDGARIWVHNAALRVTSAEDGARLMRGVPVSPERVYFRCQPRFEAAHSRWQWLAQHQFVGVGLRLPDAVHISVYKVT